MIKSLGSIFFRSRFLLRLSYIRKLYGSSSIDFRKNLSYLSDERGISKKNIIFKVVVDVFLYGITPDQFFLYGFLDKNKSQKREYINNQQAVLYIEKVSKDVRSLDNKLKFYESHKEFFKHEVYSYNDIYDNKEILDRIYQDERLVLKVTEGTCAGAGVKVVLTSDFNSAQHLLEYMEENNYGLVERFINQYDSLSRLAPCGINTVRIITEIDAQGDIHILGCRARFTYDKPLDNFGQGGLAAVVDADSGTVITPAIFKNIYQGDHVNHPVSGLPIKGFKYPFWQDAVNMVKRAHYMCPENKSIGWDIVFTKEGPGILEGNHNWCRELFQAPAGEGLIYLLNYQLN